MKSFTLISGILITLLGVFFFANPTNLLAIVGWLFALVMLISGVSSLMVYFKRDNENPLLLPTASEYHFHCFWDYFAINISMGALRCSCNHYRLVAPCLSIYTRLSSLSPTSIRLLRTTCPVNRLDLSGIRTLTL